MGLLGDTAGLALKVGGALFNAWAGARTAKKIAKEESLKNRDLLLMNARRRNESALENAENRLQSTHALGVFNAALNRQAGQNAVTGASNSRIAMQRERNNAAMAAIAGQQSAAAVARQERLLDEQAALTKAGYDAKIKRLQGRREDLQAVGTNVSSLGDGILSGAFSKDKQA